MLKTGTVFLRVAGHLAAMTVLLAAVLFLFMDRRATLDDTSFSDEIALAAEKYGIDPDFVRAMIYQESRFDPWKRGSKGEYGLMQVLPGGSAADWSRVHHRRFALNAELFDVGVNLEIGCWYLAQGLKRYRDYRGAMELALIRYNSGPSRAEAWKPETLDGDVVERIRIRSTKEYVMKIMAKYRQYKREKGARKL